MANIVEMQRFKAAHKRQEAVLDDESRQVGQLFSSVLTATRLIEIALEEQRQTILKLQNQVSIHLMEQ